jgi:hypothetical protein
VVVKNQRLPNFKVFGISVYSNFEPRWSAPVTPQARRAVLGLFVYNAAATILFVWVGAATTLHGILLWPAAILHAGIAVALLPQLLNKGSSAA